MSGTINKKEIVQLAKSFIQKKFEGESSGHDWWHIKRVRNMAIFLTEKEGGDPFIVELASLFHDLDDWKINDSDSKETEIWLKKVGLSAEESKRILDIIEQVSFKGADVTNTATSIEAKIVQDADRLDAIGAIGIARTFAYGGNKNRSIYDPNIKPKMHQSFDSYKKSEGPTINHFYEKLLLLKDRMNTNTAKKLAENRHEIMKNYLQDFFSEWNFNASNI